MTDLDRLRDRLAAWEDEKETNRYHMAHLAERAIVLLRDEIARAEDG